MLSYYTALNFHGVKTFKQGAKPGRVYNTRLGVWVYAVQYILNIKTALLKVGNISLIYF